MLNTLPPCSNGRGLEHSGPCKEHSQGSPDCHDVTLRHFAQLTGMPCRAEHVLKPQMRICQSLRTNLTRTMFSAGPIFSPLKIGDEHTGAVQPLFA